MAEVILNFKYPLNASCQVGDTAYYIPTNQLVGGFKTHAASSNITKIGSITKIEELDTNGNGNLDMVNVTCSIPINVVTPSINDFILFSKNRVVNESSIVGYYSALKFENNSKQPAELFTAACEYTGNS